MGYGILVVEDGQGFYQIINAVGSQAEAYEMATAHSAARRKELENDLGSSLHYVVNRRDSYGSYINRENLSIL